MENDAVVNKQNERKVSLNLRICQWNGQLLQKRIIKALLLLIFNFYHIN